MTKTWNGLDLRTEDGSEKNPMREEKDRTSLFYDC